MMKNNLEELTIQELEAKLQDVEQEAKKYYNFEQAVKLMLNSIYGAFGNEWFYFFNINLAETITLQGQDAILYTEKMVNKYFHEFWHRDKEAHQALGIEVTSQVRNPMVIYIDTDSCYLRFQEVLEKCNWQGDEKEFILKLYEVRLKAYIENVLEAYAKRNNSDNFLSFELESVAKNAIWMAKKKYIQNIVWKDPDIHFDNLSKISTKGFEIIQSSTPLFARNKLKELLKYFFSVEEVKYPELVALMKKVKREFKLANIEHICQNYRINNYQKYILNDYSEFEMEKGCPINVRAAGYYNYLLNNSKFKNKYKNLANGEKIKMYASKDPVCDIFAFVPGDHPYEFAPAIDYDAQFEKTIIDPINRVISAMSLPLLDRNLIYSTSVF
jgi:DNA polymerase elongation subunit (family B)